ncbi:unnamed protein product [Bursaphelenchus xylophilus]|uniref:(pine wood nematode) hypothetical protein n=1 Tax=Bursaphelenchus xylophilus TaxID=6326 RepID=A0A1I7SHX9_BURXY|nr:unnamed protein product [Bursaphelenchus xylophilus]CAG9128321.1 unnamed protein product [Bursaphelenchus xylophilus]
MFYITPPSTAQEPFRFQNGAEAWGTLHCRGQDLSHTEPVFATMYELDYTGPVRKIRRRVGNDGRFHLQLVDNKTGAMVKIFHRCNKDPKDKSCKVFQWYLPKKLIPPGSEKFMQGFGTQDLVDFKNYDGEDGCNV